MLQTPPTRPIQQLNHQPVQLRYPEATPTVSVCPPPKTSARTGFADIFSTDDIYGTDDIPEVESLGDVLKTAGLFLLLCLLGLLFGLGLVMPERMTLGGF